MTLVLLFFQTPEVEWHVTQVYKMRMYLFLHLAVNFILLINKPTFSNQSVSRGSYFHPPRFNLDTFGLEQHSVSIITFEQDAAVLICRAREFHHGPGNDFLKRNLNMKFWQDRKLLLGCLLNLSFFPCFLINLYVSLCDWTHIDWTFNWF